jgi:hypothetical protein
MNFSEEYTVSILMIDPEDGSNMFLRNILVDTTYEIFTMSHARRPIFNL